MCVQSVCVQKLKLINHLSMFVWVQLEVDCPELQGSSPLSHVLPPHSHNTLPLTFQSNTLGHFYRSVGEAAQHTFITWKLIIAVQVQYGILLSPRPVSFSVNQQHPGQILVQAEVVPLALELSTSLLVLRPNPTLLAQSGYRSSVTLRNRRNHAAEFTWKPVVTESGILFSIRPATGAECDTLVECPWVWGPGLAFSKP